MFVWRVGRSRPLIFRYVVGDQSTVDQIDPGQASVAPVSEAQAASEHDSGQTAESELSDPAGAADESSAVEQSVADDSQPVPIDDNTEQRTIE